MLVTAETAKADGCPPRRPRVGEVLTVQGAAAFEVDRGTRVQLRPGDAVCGRDRFVNGAASGTVRLINGVSLEIEARTPRIMPTLSELRLGVLNAGYRTLVEFLFPTQLPRVAGGLSTGWENVPGLDGQAVVAVDRRTVRLPVEPSPEPRTVLLRGSVSATTRIPVPANADFVILPLSRRAEAWSVTFSTSAGAVAGPQFQTTNLSEEPLFNSRRARDPALITAAELVCLSRERYAFEAYQLLSDDLDRALLMQAMSSWRSC
ncbi:MAG: hypothetical protein U0943_13650 [Brevundimonas sp.]|nr:hypothetical protein [Brevundimonas sp.]